MKQALVTPLLKKDDLDLEVLEELSSCKQLIILVKSIRKGSCSKAYQSHDYQSAT